MWNVKLAKKGAEFGNKIELVTGKVLIVLYFFHS